jgi:hypothetical protein
MVTRHPRYRSRGITALAIFFLAGALISFIAGISLVVPSAVFEAIWSVNPRGHEGLIRIGPWGVALLFTASVSCAAAAIGLWFRTRWGHVLAVALIAINLLSDIGNGFVAGDRRALVGVPVAAGILLYLINNRVRILFWRRHRPR